MYQAAFNENYLNFIRNSDLHKVSSRLCCRQIFFDFSRSSESRNDSTAFSTSRFRINCLGCFSWTDLHSGHSQNSWRPTNSEIQEWQKLWPQSSVIRIGGWNMSFICSISRKQWVETLAESIWAKNLSILSKINLRHSFLFWIWGLNFRINSAFLQVRLANNKSDTDSRTMNDLVDWVMVSIDVGDGCCMSYGDRFGPLSHRHPVFPMKNRQFHQHRRLSHQNQVTNSIFTQSNNTMKLFRQKRIQFIFDF